MLEFNKEHKSSDLSPIKEKLDEAKKYRNITICGILISSVLLLSGCVKTMDCSREDTHFHIYEKDGIVKIIDSEKEYVRDFTWTDKTIDYSEKLEGELKLLDKYDLLEISNNIKYFESFMNMNQVYREYEYTYIDREIDHYISPTGQIEFTPTSIKMVPGGKNGEFNVVANIPIYEDVEKTDWSRDENIENFTGNTRDVYTKYVGYKIIKNEDGKVELEKSPEVDNILDIKESYPYFNSKDFSVKTYEYYKIERGKTK